MFDAGEGRSRCRAKMLDPNPTGLADINPHRFAQGPCDAAMRLPRRIIVPGIPSGV